ncbi:hypothetical protein ONZ45_g8573 [Pleurotus djamor]|nr:hypothetical protein ONZ45_g8573 [Pleurotus djamor]
MSELESNRGVKRKRGGRVTKVVELDKKLPSKLHHGLKEAVKAAKKARTFETQKLVKKLKQLRTKESEKDTIEDAEDQLEALKVTSNLRSLPFKSSDE